ncbi:hypothetical protein DITRI_Ditri01bG0057100 [Diplodiscus trichospermus]
MQIPEQARESFSKRLTQSEVEHFLILFPIISVASIFNNLEEGRLFFVDAVDSTEKAWNFMGSLHNNYRDMGSVVSISWPQFASEKGLKVNDEVVFTVQPREDHDRSPSKLFKVEIRRKIRLFGQDIWGVLMI